MKVLVADTEDIKAKAFELRNEVFVVEQMVSREDEFDEFEDTSTHFVAFDDEAPIGAARWRETKNGVKLERFVVKQSHRSAGVGSALVEAVLTDIRAKKGEGQYLYLHAQLTAIPLYEKFGFQKTGPQFSECNIEHFKMDRFS
ncbi:MAG: putative GNAT family N-acyltransferase [Cyclobacteriaceae bacterium]|jgi:predicted GNAT family N-acyltransferase